MPDFHVRTYSGRDLRVTARSTSDAYIKVRRFWPKEEAKTVRLLPPSGIADELRDKGPNV